jgi:hypothetical protein
MLKRRSLIVNAELLVVNEFLNSMGYHFHTYLPATFCINPTMPASYHDHDHNTTQKRKGKTGEEQPW